jgi:hypothetical protein
VADRIPAITGSIRDPEFRTRRATHAAKTRTSVEYHIRKIVEAAPELTDAQKLDLARLLLAGGGDDAA